MDDEPAEADGTDRPGEATEQPAAELALIGEPPPELDPELELEDGPPPGSIEAEATIHLPGIGPGNVVTVNPADPYIAACLRAGYLVPTGAELDLE